jgi:hypothetical protein
VDSKENQGKCLSPLLVCVAHDGCLQFLVEVFHKCVGRRLVDSHLQKLNATHPGQELEKLKFKMTSLVSGDVLQATKAG